MLLYNYSLGKYQINSRFVNLSAMEDYNKIIESLGVKFNKTKNFKIQASVTAENLYDVENTLMLVNKGKLRFGEDNEKATEGEILFVPGGKSTTITYGSGEPERYHFEDFINTRDRYLQTIDYSELPYTEQESFSIITFEAKVFDSVNFFASLDLPAFVIQSDRIRNIMKTILEEADSFSAGHERIIKLQTDYVVVELFRYILNKQLFVEKLATNITYFKDPRLIDIFAYIRENLQGDLSNKVLSNVANVSEDYVGQYFKMLTGINPQDYIEYQRMEQAVNLLRTTKYSIREIGREVGYKDTAYFCRRFKMMFGIPAGKMRRRESLMNI